MTNKGDLISRETLLNEFNTKCQRNCPTCEYHKWNSKLNRYECELINTAPTVVNEYTKGFADGERSGRNFPLTDEEKAILVRQWQPQGEWIPVSERLPNINTVYNVTRIIEGTRITDACYFDGQNTWHRDTGVNHGRPYLTDIIAWQELPEPYQKGGKEK